MKLLEIIDFDGQQRSINLMKQNAQRQVNRAKEAQARLNIKKAQQKLLQDRNLNDPDKFGCCSSEQIHIFSLRIIFVS